MTASDGTEGADRPLLRVVRGEPDPAELAALTTVVLAAANAAAPRSGAPSRPSVWADRSALVRRPLHPGPGAWRASSLHSP